MSASQYLTAAEAKAEVEKLPQIGDVYEFDYVYNQWGKKSERLIVVDVTAEHVMYKMPGVSVNKIFPMTHEVWKANTDERRKVETLNDISDVDAWTYSSNKGEPVPAPEVT